ncbi:MAG: hypothetical protein QOJ00_1750 [Actinomycetota bacterium]
MSLLSIVVSLVLTLGGLVLVRGLARSSGFRDLGGVPVITAALVGGVVVGGGGLGRVAVAVAGAVAVGLLGLVSDDRRIDPRVRLAVEAGAAIAVVAAGIRSDLTGIGALDAVLTVFGIVGVTNAFRLLDIEQGLASTVGAVAASAVFVLAALGDQRQLAHFSGALAAACIGFAVYAGRRSQIRLGRSGSLFIGFAVAGTALALDVDGRVGATAGSLIPLLVCAVPVLNLLVVVIGRARRGVAFDSPARDHLVYRLAGAPGAAIAALVAVEIVLASLAVMVGRSMIGWPVAAGVAAVVLLVVLVVACRRAVHEAPVVGLPRAVRVASLAVVACVVIGAAAAGVALLAARRPLRDGADTATAALNAGRDGDYERASALFADAQRSFSIGRKRLAGPIPALGLLVPVVSSNMRAARLLADVGGELSTSGRTVSRQVRPERLRMQGGAVNLAEIERVAPALRNAADVMARSNRRITAARLPYLVTPVRNAVSTLRDKLQSVSATARKAADAAELAPKILGQGKPRRYFLAIENDAEARATGGFVGNYGELVAENGHIALAKFGQVSELRDGGVPFNQRTLDAPASFKNRFADRMAEIRAWTHVNITPDFPTVARMMESLYPQSGGQRVDGVISVDSVGLSALLKLTGPVNVAGWPVPFSADNIVSITTREQYEPNLSYTARRDFLGAVAETVWRRVSASDLGTPYAIADALGPASQGRHINLALRNAHEARFVRDLGIGGAVPRPRSDSLLVVNHNGGGNKVDVYLHRDIAYRVRLEPDADGTAKVTGVLDMTLHNDAPANGLTPTVLGDVLQAIKPGENFSLAAVFSPLRAGAVLVDGKRYPFRSDADLAQLVHSTYLRIAPRTDMKLQVLLAGRVPLVDGDTYALDLLHQARVEGDKVTVNIEVPKGWEIVHSDGLKPSDAQHAALFFDQKVDRLVSLRLRRVGVSGLWDAVTR